MAIGDVLQGAMGGATLGSTVPGVGTLFGALGGGLLGGLGSYFGGQGPAPGAQDLEKLRAFYDQMSQQGGVQLPPAAQAGQSGFRDNQANLISQLEALSQGRGPSLASQMLQQQTNQATENQYAQAAGARGNPALANRQAMNNAAQLQSQAGAQMANARVAEQLGALQQLGLGIYGARGQDEGLSQFNAGQTNQMATEQGRLGQMNNQIRLQALQQMMSGAMQQGAYQAQQPGVGDYLMAFGGGLGQMRGFGQQPQQDARGNRGYYG